MKPRIAFVTGGYSGEAEISYQSAKTIEKNLDPDKFDVYKIDIRPQAWVYLHPQTGEPHEINKHDFSLTLASGKVTFDAVFIGIHGTPGEDGKLQAYFDLMGLPYTGCNCAVSALTFNKRFTVAVASFSGIAVAKSVLLYRGYSTADAKSARALRFPVFVKPNNGGSSLGMSKVMKADDGFDEALAKAFREDDQVLVEEFIEGREFTIGVFNAGTEIVCLPITEIISNNAFFDYEAKYLGASEEITPANIDAPVRTLIEQEASKIYKIFNCRGLVRIDFIYNSAKHAAFMLEINTVPGQTAASLVPQQVAAAGLQMRDIYTNLLEACLRK